MKRIRIMVKPGTNTKRIKKVKAVINKSSNKNYSPDFNLIKRKLFSIENKINGKKVKEKPEKNIHIANDIMKGKEYINIIEKLESLENELNQIKNYNDSGTKKDNVKEKIYEKIKLLEDKLKGIKNKKIVGGREIIEEPVASPSQEKIIVVQQAQDQKSGTGKYDYKEMSDESIKKINFGGIEIPEIKESVKEELKDVTEEDKKKIDIKYSLVPKHPKKDEPVFAYAHIHWNDKFGTLVYDVTEPKITKEDKENIIVIKEYIEDKINVVFDEISKKEAIEYLNKKITEAFRYFNINDKSRQEVLRYYIFRDFLGFGKLHAILNDPNIEDVSCDGVNIPIFVYHKDNRIGSIATNIKFNSKEELDSFVMKLAEKCKKTISILKPLLDGTLPDGSRAQATLGSDIAGKGSNFTIRKFPEKPLTPTDLLLNGTFDINIATYLWMVIENSSSILISGGTATGKTSMLNAISLFIPKESKIVSIEDTAEIRLFHSNWIPEIARTSMDGSVTMFDLLKESLRQRPDYIIVGEVRGKEAYVLFQQMATGHPGISTIHAENFDKLLDRLTTQPINLPPSLIENLDIIVFLKGIKYKNRYIRRVNEIVEVLGYDRKTNQPITKTLFKWNAQSDKFELNDKSYILKKIMNLRGISENDIKSEFENRAKLLQWISLRKINDYRLFTRIIDLYNTNKEEVLMRIEAEL